MVIKFKEWLKVKEAVLDPTTQQQIIGTLSGQGVGGGASINTPDTVATKLATSNAPLVAAIFNNPKALAVDAAAKKQLKKANPQQQQITNTSMPANLGALPGTQG